MIQKPSGQRLYGAKIVNGNREQSAQDLLKSDHFLMIFVVEQKGEKMRAIDADALLANRQILRGGDVIGIRDYVTVAEIENAPTIEPERETGEWLANEHDDIPLGLMISCSKCGGELLVNDVVYYDYCPYCGSFNQAVYNSEKMRGENGGR